LNRAYFSIHWIQLAIYYNSILTDIALIVRT
jgi:hypothetical protein